MASATEAQNKSLATREKRLKAQMEGNSKQAEKANKTGETCATAKQEVNVKAQKANKTMENAIKKKMEAVSKTAEIKVKQVEARVKEAAVKKVSRVKLESMVKERHAKVFASQSTAEMKKKKLEKAS